MTRHSGRETGRPYPSRILVVDLECTCSDDAAVPRHQMEIIEIGAVWADLVGEPIAEFQTFVRPRINPVLTDFCRHLTSITQNDIDSALSFFEAMKGFTRFIASHRSDNAVWASWGIFDARQFELDFDRAGTKSTLDLPYVNLKQRFARAFGLRRPCSMMQALDLAGLTMQGTHHRGLDDARNVVRLIPLVYATPDGPAGSSHPR